MEIKYKIKQSKLQKSFKKRTLFKAQNKKKHKCFNISYRSSSQGKFPVHCIGTIKTR